MHPAGPDTYTDLRPEEPRETGGPGPVLDWWDTRKALRDTWTEQQWEIRHWQHLVAWPWAAAASTWVYGMCSHALATTTHAVGTTATLAGLGAAGVVFVIRFGLRRVFVARWSLRFWLAGAVASVWSLLTTVVGPSWLLAGALTLATVLLSAAWYRVHRLSVPEPETEVLVEPEPETEPEPWDLLHELGGLWHTYFGTHGKKFTGSIFTGGERLRNGVRAEIHLDPELHHYGMLASDDVLSRLAAVVGHLNITRDDILIEPHPSGDHSKGVVTFLTANPLADGVPYQGPRYDRGLIAVGPWCDGEGWGAVQLADHKASVFNILATGDPGKGKSVFLENLGMSALHSGCWKVLFLDGSEHADSSGLLNDWMTASEAGVEGAWKQLEAVNEYLATRGVENNALPAEIRGVNPSPERMGLLWIIDELHRLCHLDPKFAKELAQVVRLGRKRGLAVAAATQGVDLNDDFGGVTALRDILTSMNVVAFYASSTYAHTMISGPPIAPNKLPSGGGYAYLKAPTMHRALKLRTDFSQDMTPWARKIPDYPWDQVGWLAMKRYLESKGSDEEAREARRVEAQRQFQIRLDRLAAGLPGTPPAEEQKPIQPAPFADLMAKMPRELTLADVVPLHPAPAQDTTRDEVHHEILDLVDAGVDETGEIVRRVMAAREISERTVKRKLAELREWGELEYAGNVQGHYVRPESAA